MKHFLCVYYNLGYIFGMTMRVIRCVTCPFNPTAMPHAPTTNKGAAVIAYVRGIQAALAIEV